MPVPVEYFMSFTPASGLGFALSEINVKRSNNIIGHRQINEGTTIIPNAGENGEGDDLVINRIRIENIYDTSFAFNTNLFSNFSQNSQRKHVSDAWLQQLKVWEKFAGKLYTKDGSKSGNCTIGYGHLIRSGKCLKEDYEKYKDGITEAEAEELLRQDLAKSEEVVQRNVTLPLDQYQFDAMVDFAFRIGSGRFPNSDAVTSLNAGDYEIVPLKILQWGRGRGQKRRAKAEALWFSTLMEKTRLW